MGAPPQASLLPCLLPDRRQNKHAFIFSCQLPDVLSRILGLNPTSCKLRLTRAVGLQSSGKQCAIVMPVLVLCSGFVSGYDSLVNTAAGQAVNVLFNITAAGAGLAAGSRRLLAAGDFLIVSSPEAAFVSIAATAFDNLEFQFDAGASSNSGFVYASGGAAATSANPGSSSGGVAGQTTPLASQVISQCCARAAAAIAAPTAARTVSWQCLDCQTPAASELTQHRQWTQHQIT